MTKMGGPLDGVRIVDLTSVIMGPLATHILADMGADVIKIESPEGDSLRNYHPLRHPGMSGNFLHLNRNKRSVLLDLKRSEDKEILDRLIGTADVFVHSLRPKAIENLGYGYSRVATLRSDIIYCGAYGFGENGPYGNKAAYDDIIQAGSGLAALAEQIGGTPAYLPTVLCDKLAGQAIAYAVLAALFQHSRDGRGQKIEVPMFETTVEFAAVEHMGGYTFEPPLGPPGFKRVLNAHRKPYRTKDSFACILPYSDRNWRDFYQFTGRTEFCSDPRFQTLAQRVMNIEVLYALVEHEAVRRTTTEWIEFCDSASIPCMPVLALADLPDDPHLKAVGLFATVSHPTEGLYRSIRPPVSFSGHQPQIRRHAPRLGEHTAEILQELGLKAKDGSGLENEVASARVDV
jgi:crotonobetainyl-CoA:carnitine CoA-transferase CaiB-like acyl-CoA transferase